MTREAAERRPTARLDGVGQQRAVAPRIRQATRARPRRPGDEGVLETKYRCTWCTATSGTAGSQRTRPYEAVTVSG